MGEHICYYCGKPATTKEHVPPKCLFPEKEDAFGKHYRKNLITVPSCEKHNLQKSNDDEFLMACLAPIVGNDPIGFVQTHTKLKRAIKRHKGRLMDEIMKEPKDFNIVSESGTAFPVLLGKPDLPRLYNAFESIARGIYYKEKGEPFKGRCIVIPDFAKFKDQKLEKIKYISRLLIERDKDDWTSGGANPKIFKFYLGPPDINDLIPMYLSFYEGADVFISLQPEGVSLPDQSLEEMMKDTSVKIVIKQDKNN